MLFLLAFCEWFGISFGLTGIFELFVWKESFYYAGRIDWFAFRPRSFYNSVGVVKSFGL